MVRSRNDMVIRDNRIVVEVEFFKLMDKRKHNTYIVSMFITIVLHETRIRPPLQIFVEPFLRNPFLRSLMWSWKTSMKTYVFQNEESLGS